MNKNLETRNNYFLELKKFIKEKYKILLFFLIFIFFIFLSFQFYSYYNLKNIEKNSLAYFNAKDIKSNDEFYNIMKKLSQNNDFYSVLAQLEMIKVNLEEKNFNVAEEIYINLLDNNKLNDIYISAIASQASYSFINVYFENQDLKYVPIIKKFINYIDENLDNYEGIKLELMYLLAIAEQDIKNLSPSNDKNANDLYKLIMESQNISSYIKDRVNKIHEFQNYK